MLEKLMNLNQEEIEEACAMAKEWMDEFVYSPHNQKTQKLEMLSEKIHLAGITPNEYHALLMGFALAKASEEQSEEAQEEAEEPTVDMEEAQEEA